MDVLRRTVCSLSPVAALALVLTGCNQTSPEFRDAPDVVASPTGTAAPSTAAPFRTVWEAHYLQDTKVGYGRTTYYREKLAGRPVVRIVSEAVLTVLRFGKPFQQKYRDVFWETESGEVLRFEVEMNLGTDAPQTTIGTVNGEQASLVVQSAHGVQQQMLAWPLGTGGSTASLESLRRKPMEPGETREVRTFLPSFNLPAVMTLTARDRETVDVDGQSRELLRVDVRATRVEGQPLFDLQLWTDGEGEVWRMYMGLIQQLIVRTTESRARALGEKPPVDLGKSSFVSLAKPLDDAHGTQQVRYRVVVSEGDAAKAFPASASQSVKPLADGAAEVTVSALRPDTPLPPDYVPTPPDDAVRRSNAVVASDDPEVQKLAAEAAGDETDPWRVAVRCESLVHKKMNAAVLGAGFDFSKAFAGAAETARSLRGDCTEHAVLLAALLRARGVPSRVALGLVYVPAMQAFGYHLWTEAHVNDRWIPLDATVGQGGTSAAYLKLADAHLDGVDSLSAFLPLLQVVGRLQIEVLERK